VVFIRLAVPLFIPRFPLPAILLVLVIDGVDQTIFGAADMASVLANYQSYDKALDIYYLVIAYTSTLRTGRIRTHSGSASSSGTGGWWAS
jgi:hypothetical protein